MYVLDITGACCRLPDEEYAAIFLSIRLNFLASFLRPRCFPNDAEEMQRDQSFQVGYQPAIYASLLPRGRIDSFPLSTPQLQGVHGYDEVLTFNMYVCSVW